MATGLENPAVIVARGPRAVEERLLDEIVERLRAGEVDPKLLARPVRVIVPSRSLRQQLAGAIVRRCGRAVVGLQVQTLHALVLEILDRGGVEARAAEVLYPVLVRQVAREHELLCHELDDLVDGYGSVTSVVSDLLDAGFEPNGLDAVRDAIRESPGSERQRLRAIALAETAAEVYRRLEASRVGHRALQLEQARQLLGVEAERVLPARAVLVHGFAEATGQRAELLEALVRYRDARVFLDEPADPARPEQADAGIRFLDRLRIRFEGIAAVERFEAPGAAPKVMAFDAPGASAELREVAVRIRRRLEAGRTAPERIGVVARDWSGSRAALRQHFDRLGIPYSGVGERGAATAAARRISALLDLLHGGPRSLTDRWLDAAVRLDGAGGGARVHSDLRFGLRQRGAIRIEDVAGLDLDGRDLFLKVVGGWDFEGDHGPRPERRRLRAAELERAVRCADSACRRLRQLRSCRSLGAFCDGLDRMLRNDLGWDAERSDCGAGLAALESLRTGLPDATSLSFEDFQLLIRHVLEGTGRDGIGGAGGGVQVLSVMEARARTFDALFVVGLNRDVFPRGISEDPLLPDSIRKSLRAVLLEMPVKRAGHDEERYLFAQLLGSSPEITLSWQSSDDDGKERVPSSFVERLGWGPGGRDVEHAASCQARGPDAAVAGLDMTPAERAALAGLRSGRRNFAALLPSAVAFSLEDLAAEGFAAGGLELAGTSAVNVAQARLAWLDEIEGRGDAKTTLGPHFGFIGKPRHAGDPRFGPLYITTLEGMARCGWQTFVRKLLGIEVLPDPLQALPGSDPRLVGSTVHAVLERLVRDRLREAPADLSAARSQQPVEVAWPDAAELSERIGAAAREVLVQAGIGLPGLEHVLREQARPFLDRVRELDWVDGERLEGVVGVEVEGAFELAGPGGDRREIRFRADRVDLTDGKHLRLTDYKTGRPISNLKKPETRERDFIRSVAKGSNLQAVAYRNASGPGGVGRFLFLGDDLEPDTAEYLAGEADTTLSVAFDRCARAVLGAWEVGAFLPRLVDHAGVKEFSSCEYCEVSQACLQGDSGARARLVGWIETRDRRRRRVSGEAEALDWWDLQAPFDPTRAASGGDEG